MDVCVCVEEQMRFQTTRGKVAGHKLLKSKYTCPLLPSPAKGFHETPETTRYPPALFILVENGTQLEISQGDHKMLFPDAAAMETKFSNVVRLSRQVIMFF